MRRTILVGFLVAAIGGAFVSDGANAQTCAANVSHVTGTWVVLPYQMPINPISANLLSNGLVLIVAGSEADKNNSKGPESYRAAIWDPTGADESSIAVQNLTYDVFCSGTAALPDGRSLIVGGTSDYTFTGENRASIFDPTSGSFVQSQNMVAGRWYASATALGDGRIMAMSGYLKTGGTSRSVEIYDLRNAGAGWSLFANVPFSPPLYPRLALLPNGKVFYTGQGSGTYTANAWIFDPSSGIWTTSAPITRNRSYGSSVMLPLLAPNYTPRVMNFGGGNPATPSTEIIDLSVATPSWTPGPNMSTGRIQMNAVILPNGNVLAAGGSVTDNSPNTPGKTADLYDPATNTFRSAGTAAYSRLYHSTALLLPDATVVSMGSNPGPRGSYQAAIEIYTPPYLFDANDHLITTNRPSITALSPASEVVGYNTPFSLSYTSTSAINAAVLVRPGSSTHAFDMDQRLIGLCGPAPQPTCDGANNTLNLISPPNGNVAPPGYYMLFLLDSAGVPSKASFIQLTPYSTVPPTATISLPASDVTIPAGETVNFGTSSSAAKYSWVFPGGSPATSTAQNPGNVTFASPGTYQASLTVIDSSGNSDPSPPTRKITVTPITPDFSITVGPSAQEVQPGEAATFTVTVTPVSGFTGPVSLSVDSENGFTAGVSSAGFSPASISDSGSSTLTMVTTTSTKPWAISLTITGTSGTLTRTASTTLLVNLAPPASLAATPGHTQVSLSWPGSVGASSYHVKRANVSGGPYVTLACPAGTSYVDSGLTDGIAYYYAVSAAFSGNPNAGGESADSSEASATPAAQTAPAITSANSTTFTVGAAGSFTVTTTGSPTPSLTQTGVLPSGVTFANNGNGTATLSGTPAAGTAGSYPITITASNGVGTPANQSFTLTVNTAQTAPAITSANSTIFTVGAAGSFTVTTTGAPTPSLTKTGALPSGVTFVNNGNGTATLSGTPAAGTAGSYPITITASNGVGTPANQSFTLTVNTAQTAPAITSANSTIFTVGAAGSFTVTTTGAPTPSLTKTGALPSGVTFVNNGNGTATLSGTPAAGTAGSYPITITASNGVGTPANQSFTLTVNTAQTAPAITSANSTIFTVGAAGSFTVTTTGAPTPSLTQTGVLPSGVTFVNNGNGTATLSGTPAAGTAGSYPITITASNGVGTPANQSFTLTVNTAQTAPAITSANSTTFTVGAAGSFTVTTTGSPTPSLTQTGVLPSGVTFVNNGNGTATLSGTPAAGTAGSYPITITASNGVGTPANQSFTLTVNTAQTAPAITSANSTIFTVGAAGSFTVTTTGAPTPSLTKTGALPSGVTFVNNGNGTATLSGTPAAGTAGSYPITITASNGVGTPANQSFTLTVNQAPAITSANSTTFTVGAAGSFTVTTTGSPTPSLTQTGVLPSGVIFVNNGNGTATLSGTPAAGTAGSYPITITASNGVGTPANQSFTLKVNKKPH